MVSLTNHQWDAVKKTLAWYEDAANFYRPTDTTIKFVTEPDGHREEVLVPVYGNGAGLGRGQDFFFGGYAGTGKTTVVPTIIEELGLSMDQVAFVCPTGKAAKVLTSKLNGFGMRTTATTIHKLIYRPAGEEADRIQTNINDLLRAVTLAKEHKESTVCIPVGESIGDYVSVEEAEDILFSWEMELDAIMERTDGPKFIPREPDEFPENVKLLVVDEGSMVGAEIAGDLAQYGRPILAFGDPGQLPPVNDSYGFECENPDAFLTEIHRQAADNPIIELATMVRQGRQLPLCDFGDVKVVERRNDDVTLNMDRDAMILCGTHKKRWNLTKKIRNALGYTETGPCEGEPLLVHKNSQKITTMVNGTIVKNLTEHGNLTDGNAEISLSIEEDYYGKHVHEIKAAQALFEEHHLRKKNGYTAAPAKAFAAKKNCENVDWGYVLTVHKSQGSQWDDVVVHDESGVFREAASRWLYTGITRSSEKLTVVV